MCLFTRKILCNIKIKYVKFCNVYSDMIIHKLYNNISMCNPLIKRYICYIQIKNY